MKSLKPLLIDDVNVSQDIVDKRCKLFISFLIKSLELDIADFNIANNMKKIDVSGLISKRHKHNIVFIEKDCRDLFIVNVKYLYKKYINYLKNNEIKDSYFYTTSTEFKSILSSFLSDCSYNITLPTKNRNIFKTNRYGEFKKDTLIFNDDIVDRFNSSKKILFLDNIKIYSYNENKNNDSVIISMEHTVVKLDNCGKILGSDIKICNRYNTLKRFLSDLLEIKEEWDDLRKFITSIDENFSYVNEFVFKKYYNSFEKTRHKLFTDNIFNKTTITELKEELEKDEKFLENFINNILLYKDNVDDDIKRVIYCNIFKTKLNYDNFDYDYEVKKQDDNSFYYVYICKKYKWKNK